MLSILDQSQKLLSLRHKKTLENNIVQVEKYQSYRLTKQQQQKEKWKDEESLKDGCRLPLLLLMFRNFLALTAFFLN